MTQATVEPPIYPLVIPRRATLLETIRLPFDGTGLEVFAQVWKDYRRNQLLIQLEVEVIETTPKLMVEISAPWEITREIRRDAVWDLLIVYPDGTRDHWLKGPAVVDERATEATP